MSMAPSRRPHPELLSAVVAALDTVDDQVVIVDEQSRILHVNVAWQRFGASNGSESAHWIGTDYVAATTAAVSSDGESIAAGIRDVLERRRTRFSAEYDCHAPDELRWFLLRATDVGVPGVGAVITHTDITNRRRAVRTLERRATHDPLTGLVNRAALEAAVGEMLREGRVVGLLAFTLGDAAVPGAPPSEDGVAAAALMLVELFSPPAVLGRYADDQLVLLLAGASSDGLREMDAIVRDALADGLVGARQVRVSVALGLAHDPADGAGALADVLAASRAGSAAAADD